MRSSGCDLKLTEGALPMAQRFGKRGAPQTFARKLFNILVENESIISWNDEGDTFTVHDSKTFSQETLTKYYRHGKFSSFQRQLNMYGFRKVPNSGRSYSHPFFRRDSPELLNHVRRVTPAVNCTSAPGETEETETEVPSDGHVIDKSDKLLVVSPTGGGKKRRRVAGTPRGASQSETLPLVLVQQGSGGGRRTSGSRKLPTSVSPSEEDMRESAGVVETTRQTAPIAPTRTSVRRRQHQAAAAAASAAAAVVAAAAVPVRSSKSMKAAVGNDVSGAALTSVGMVNAAMARNGMTPLDGSGGCSSNALGLSKRSVDGSRVDISSPSPQRLVMGHRRANPIGLTPPRSYSCPTPEDMERTGCNTPSRVIARSSSVCREFMSASEEAEIMANQLHFPAWHSKLDKAFGFGAALARSPSVEMVYMVHPEVDWKVEGGVGVEAPSDSAPCATAPMKSADGMLTPWESYNGEGGKEMNARDDHHSMAMEPSSFPAAAAVQMEEVEDSEEGTVLQKGFFMQLLQQELVAPESDLSEVKGTKQQQEQEHHQYQQQTMNPVGGLTQVSSGQVGYGGDVGNPLLLPLVEEDSFEVEGGLEWALLNSDAAMAVDRAYPCSSRSGDFNNASGCLTDTMSTSDCFSLDGNDNNVIDGGDEIDLFKDAEKGGSVLQTAAISPKTSRTEMDDSLMAFGCNDDGDDFGVTSAEEDSASSCGALDSCRNSLYSPCSARLSDDGGRDYVDDDMFSFTNFASAMGMTASSASASS
ncbi:unnamed protein product [Choristocarpus tenellus]